MNHSRKNPKQIFFSGLLALSFFTMNIAPLAIADPNIGDAVNAPINSVVDGYKINSGTYANTAGGETRFQNSAGNGLLLSSGSNIRAHQVDANGNYNGNGGRVHFWAPGQVVRLDGTVNVSGALKGGEVLVNSAYLYQNGQIYANGASGGSVQFNVGNATFGPNAKIEALGSQNADGQININAVGFVDFQSSATANLLVSSTGQTLAALNSNHINVEGALVNVDGLLQANGSYATSDGGTIRVVANGNSDNCFGCTLDAVRIVSTDVNGLPIAGDVIFTDSEINTLIARRDQLFNGSVAEDGSVYVSARGQIVANGSDASKNTAAGNGGTIAIASANDIVNDGFIRADGGDGYHGIIPSDGGNGGLVTLNADDDVLNNCHITANGGKGGNANVDAQPQVVAGDFRFVDDDGKFQNVNSPNSWENIGTAQGVRTDSSARDGGNGGNGGAVGISAGGDIINNVKIEAKGGNGGFGANASASQTVAGSTNGTAIAAAQAYAGDGGNGGDGGLIVLTADQNPTGGGKLDASGGNGGQGGDAYAYAKTSSHKHAGALAQAIAGNGGDAGKAGTIVAPDASTLKNTQNVILKDGNAGHSGDATAIADAGALKTENGEIKTWFAHAIADAQTGDYGTANADAKAKGVDAARARANAITGDRGEAIANAEGQGKWYGYADSDAAGGDFATVSAKSVADAAGYWNGAPVKGAFSTADANAGDFSVANADAKSTSYVFTEKKDYIKSGSGSNQRNAAGSDAEAFANANTGDHGMSNSKAYAEGQQFIKAVADSNSGLAGMSDADADAIQKGYEVIDPLAIANATAGDFGKANADAYAHGNWDSHAHSNATTGLVGQSNAKSYAYSFVNLADASATAISGDHGQSNADAESVSQHRNKDSKAKALAETGQHGSAIADAKATTIGGWNHKAYADATANFDTNGYGKATATTDGKSHSYANADVNGQTDSAQGKNVRVAQVTQDNSQSVTAPTLIVTAPVATAKAVTQHTGNELVLHNDSAVLMTVSGNETSVNNTLTTATVRTVTQQNGGAILNPANVKQLVVDNNTGADLDLDQAGYTNLDHLLVQNDGSVANQQQLVTAKTITIQADDHFVNTDTMNSGNINITTGGTTANIGEIATHDGGNVIIKAGEDILNAGLIAASGVQTAGQVQLRADRDIINVADIRADGSRTAGSIVAKAGQYNVNAANVTANASNGSAGYIHLHGDNVALNTADIEANGEAAGGRVLLTAGDKDQTNNDRGADISPYIAGNTAVGFSNRALTPAVTTLDTTVDFTVAESAINAGNISTTSNTADADGKIYVAGNNQFGFVEGSTLNGVTVDVASILAAPLPSQALQVAMSQVQNNGGNVYAVVGQQITNSQGDTVTAVEAVACDAAPGNREPDVNPNDPTRQGSEFPDDFTLPDPNTPPNGGPNYDVLGLFQQERPAPVAPPAPRRLKIRMDDSKMFAASAYQSVTEEILALALDEYNRVLSSGQVPEEANRQMKLYLLESGIDPAVAYTLMEEAACGCGDANNGQDDINNIKLVDEFEEFQSYCKFAKAERVAEENEIITQVAVADGGAATGQVVASNETEEVETTACKYENTDILVLKALAEIAKMPTTEKGRQDLLLQ